MRIVFVLIFVLYSSILYSVKPKYDLCILPQPKKIEYLGGGDLSLGDIRFIINKGGEEYPILGSIMGTLPRIKKEGKGVFLSITEQDVPTKKEGYTLVVDEDGMHISSKSNAGLFYGIQTGEQLLEDCRDFGTNIPFLRIIDYPSIDYRAVHLDTKHHLDRIEYYYRLIDKWSRYKINAVIWEVEDKLQFSRHPEISSSNAISKQEMQSICKYAKDRHIEISPLIQGLGHASYILQHHWELRENPKSDWEICPVNENSYQMLYDLYLDALEAMPYGKYLHIGGDEITQIGIDNRCRETNKSSFELQMYWLNRVCTFAKQHGRIPIFWDDMPLKYAGVWDIIRGNYTEEELQRLWNTDLLDKAIELFPKECIYMRWNYSDATQLAHRKLLEWYRDKGLQVMGATAASSGNSPFMPRNYTNSNYIKGFSSLVDEFGLAGILSTAWDDGSPHLETVMRGYIAQGEYGWNPNGRSISDFVEVHGQREFGLKAGTYKMKFVQELEESFFFFDDALVDKGRRNPAWGVTDFELIELPSKSKHGIWFEKYKAKIKRAEFEELRYNTIRKELFIIKKEALRNRYTLDVYEQNNVLQNIPVQILLLLRDYDVAKNEQKRQMVLKEIKVYCCEFFQKIDKIKEVYSKTRFMEQPAGYVMDMNHHNHLSIKTFDSNWLFLYELPFVERLQHWIDM